MSDLDMEEWTPEDAANAGAEGQAAEAKPADGTRRTVPTTPLPDVFQRMDAGERPALALVREQIVDRILEVDTGCSAERAVAYADLWLEYMEAQDNIDRYGVICAHPRTAVIIENPYVQRRDKTRVELHKIRDVRAGWLWRDDAIQKIRAWLFQAQAQRQEEAAKRDQELKEAKDAKNL